MRNNRIALPVCTVMIMLLFGCSTQKMLSAICTYANATAVASPENATSTATITGTPRPIVSPTPMPEIISGYRKRCLKIEESLYHQALCQEMLFSLSTRRRVPSRR